jgi:hypothetical protein
LRCAGGSIRCEIGEVLEQAEWCAYGILNGCLELLVREWREFVRCACKERVGAFVRAAPIVPILL